MENYEPPEVVMKRKGKNPFFILKRLYKVFPKQIVVGEEFSSKELNYLVNLDLIKKIHNNMVRASDMQKIGEVDSFQITPLGLDFLNQITLKKINVQLLVLTLILVGIGILQIFLQIKSG